MLPICNINIDYLFSQTFQLSISSSTNKVTHFDIIGFYLSKNYHIYLTYIGKKKNIWNKDECLLLWFLGTRITSVLLCHCLPCLSPLTPAWNNSINHSWKFHTEDRGGCWRLHRHIKKEEEKEITISLIVFERQMRPRSVESVQWTWS